MNVLKVYRISLAIAGSIVLLAGLSHFAWHAFMRGYGELSGLSEAQWRFLTLLNHSVGLLLVFQGAAALAIAASRDAGLSLLRTFASLTFAMWCTRLAFEVVLPVPIPFFVMERPSTFFGILMAALLAILATPELLLITCHARR